MPEVDPALASAYSQARFRCDLGLRSRAQIFVLLCCDVKESARRRGVSQVSHAPPVGTEQFLCARSRPYACVSV